MEYSDDLVLVLDCDGIIMDSVKLIEEAVARVDYRCKKKYIECIKAWSQRKEAEITDKFFWEDHDTYDRLINDLHMTVDRYIKINRITFDEVVEEVFPNYIDKIDYESIYQIVNAYPGVIEKIKELFHSKKIRKIYICTHCNSKSEINAKKRFFKEYLPMIEVIFVHFHDMPYIYNSNRYFENKERKRTNKAERFFSSVDEDPANTIFIDDSREICDEAECLGSMAIYRDRTMNDPLQPFRELEHFLNGETITGNNVGRMVLCKKDK